MIESDINLYNSHCGPKLLYKRPLVLEHGRCAAVPCTFVTCYYYIKMLHYFYFVICEREDFEEVLLVRGFAELLWSSRSKA